MLHHKRYLKFVCVLALLLVVVGSSSMASARNDQKPLGMTWTAWLDRDDPSGVGDFEDIADLRGSIPCERPMAIECKALDGRDWTQTGEVFTPPQNCTLQYGLACVNANQPDGACLDYKVRFACPSCWAFQFGASVPFPNPAGSGTSIRERMNLLVLGDDSNMYPATIRSEVYNVAGQLVYTRSESRNSSPSFDMVVWEVGNVASGRYTIRVRAESSLCGNSGWTSQPAVIVN
jgi:hypothetical protein